MERIERALEVARLHRHRLNEAGSAPAAPPTPSFAEVASSEPARARIEDAPPIELGDRDSLRERYVVFPDEAGPAALAYKMLRTQVLRRTREHAMRCIGVVSAASGEGKTVTAINLALSLSLEPNQSVILVDFDLKRPRVAATLQLAFERGLESHFADGTPFESMWRRCAPFERLAIVPTLAPIGGSSEIVAGRVTSELVRKLREVSGEPLVLFDLPPLLLSDDVLAFAPLLDGVVVVVAEEQTRREDLNRIFELLRATPVIGTVLNASADAEIRTY